jgi:hypothetical protein
MIDPNSVLAAWGSRPLPERVTLDNKAFTNAFEAFRLREEAAARKVTYETFSDEVGVNERVLRKTRTGQGKLPRHQVQNIAKRLGCTPWSIVERPESPSLKAQNERDQKDRVAWPVPLREVASWVEFVEHLERANSVRPSWKDDVLSLAAAPAIDAFKAALRYSSQVAKDNPAIAAAALKDAAEDLQAYGLHVLVGRYVARGDSRQSYDDMSTEIITVMIHVLEVWICREIEDLTHVVGRSNEPMCGSEQELWNSNDNDLTEGWLAWEDKRRLFLWRDDAPV